MSQSIALVSRRSLQALPAALCQGAFALDWRRRGRRPPAPIRADRSAFRSRPTPFDASVMKQERKMSISVLWEQESCVAIVAPCATAKRPVHRPSHSHLTHAHRCVIHAYRTRCGRAAMPSGPERLMAVVPSPNHHAARATGDKMHAPFRRWTRSGGGLDILAAGRIRAQAKRIVLRRMSWNGTEPDDGRSPHCDPQRTRKHRDDSLCTPVRSM